MTPVLRRLDSWLWPSAPPERLAIFRILTGLFTVGYLAVRLPVFLALAHRERSSFDPIGVLWFLRTPLPAAAVTGLAFVAVVLGIAYTAGVAFRLVGPVFAVVLLVLTTYRSSWGQLLWFEDLAVLHVLIVGFAPSADAFAVRRGPAARRDSQAYGAPVRLAAAVTVATYLLSGVAKLRLGGLGWMSADTLRNHIAYSAARLEVLGGTASPLAAWLVAHTSFLAPLAVGTVALEVGAPMALLGGRIRTGWVVATWLLHTGIAMTLLVVFPYPLCGVAFAPFFRLERAPQVARAWRARFLSTRPPSDRPSVGEGLAGGVPGVQRLLARALLGPSPEPLGRRSRLRYRMLAAITSWLNPRMSASRSRSSSTAVSSPARKRW